VTVDFSLMLLVNCEYGIVIVGLYAVILNPVKVEYSIPAVPPPYPEETIWPELVVFIILLSFFKGLSLIVNPGT
jgi:hypothetical protein